MPILVRALSSISDREMPTDRTASVHSTISDFESLDSVTIVNPHSQVIEIASQPEFYIFTSLLWIRTADQDLNQLLRLGDPNDTPTGEADVCDIFVPDGTKPDFGLLRYHRDRLAAAADALHWWQIRALDASEEGLSILRSSIYVYLQCLPQLSPDRIERRKLRLMVNKMGNVVVDSTVMDCILMSECDRSIASFPPKTLDFSDGIDTQNVTHPRKLSLVYTDTRPIRPSLFTTHKTSHRAQYDAARKRTRVSAFAPTEKEVLVFNKNGEVMEASLCTVYFFRNDTWITPAAICGGNLGVTRRMALERGLCRQGSIEVTELRDGEKIWLSNGARGFFMGQVCLNKGDYTLHCDSDGSV